MKTKFLPLLLILMTCFLYACEQPDTPTVEPALNDQLAIIKLPPEMIDRVFVSPIVDSCVVDYASNNVNTLYYGDGLVLCNLTAQDSLFADFAQSQLGITGTNPYVLLANGYAIVDWKWSHFQPLSGDFRSTLFYSPKIYDNKKAQEGYSTNFYYLNGTLANEEYYLLPINWQELSDLTSIWPLLEGQRIIKPEVRYINLKDIEKYGNCQMSNIELSQKYNVTIFDLHSTYQLYLRDVDRFKEYAKECDILQAQYVGVLNQMITNNDLGTWKQY